ncbi:MAG: hypothetical protein L3J65_01485 [Robiginitomaculum sp.]|nr:hypothetical protein [Robiginitomaculum sp.]
MKVSEQKEVEKLVTEFFNEYAEWYKFAYDYSVKYPDNDSPLEERYDALIERYCVPGKKRQGTAYGNGCPKQKTTKFEATPAGAIVHALQSEFDDDYWSKHEYHLTKISGKWYINEMYYIGGNKKYPSL